MQCAPAVFVPECSRPDLVAFACMKAMQTRNADHARSSALYRAVELTSADSVPNANVIWSCCCKQRQPADFQLSGCCSSQVQPACEPSSRVYALNLAGISYRDTSPLEILYCFHICSSELKCRYWPGDGPRAPATGSDSAKVPERLWRH